MLKINWDMEGLPEEIKKDWKIWRPIHEGIMNYAYDVLKETEGDMLLTRTEVKGVINESMELVVELLQNKEMLDFLSEMVMKYHLKSKDDRYTD